MQIKRFSAANFKCFRKLDVSFSRITLLTGENSSGKSSLIYGILSVFQSDAFPFRLSPNGKYVNMGDFTEMSFNGLKNKRIELGICLTDRAEGEQKFETAWVLDRRNNMPRLDRLRAITELLDLEINADGSQYVLRVSLDQKNIAESKELEVGRLVGELFASLSEIIDEDADSETETLQKLKQGLMEFKEVESLGLASLDAKELSNKLSLGTNYLISVCMQGLRRLDNNLNFVGSFRLQPERAYYQRSKSDYKVDKHGENYPDQILNWERRQSPKFKELKSILRELNLLRTIRTRKLRSGRFELRVQAKSRGAWASLADVGFGISQFLPIIVADLQLPDDSTLVLAQPEIHLHPSVQAAIADYLVTQINEHEKSYIVETHSEYLLNRIRLAIVKGQLEPSDVSVYYFENSADGSIMHSIEFTKDGQIRNAPKGFFETHMMDVMDIAINA